MAEDAAAPLALAIDGNHRGSDMAGKRAICVGINKFARYPQFTLNGCVNDAKDMAAYLKRTASRRPR